MPSDLKSVLLDYYHCTFFLPLTGLEEKGITPDERYAYNSAGLIEPKNRLDEARAQAYRYFSPVLRNILFDTGTFSDESHGLLPLKEWHLPEEKIEDWELHLGYQQNRNDPFQYQIAKIVAVDLYRYFNGVTLLSFRVEPKALRDLRKTQNCILFKSSEKIELDEAERCAPDNAALFRQLQLECWLRFTQLARLIYPSFPEQRDERKIAPIRLLMGEKAITAFEEPGRIGISKKPGEVLSLVVRTLLGSFAGPQTNPNDALYQSLDLFDDRMFVSVAYGLANQTLDRAATDKVFSIAAFVDRIDDGFESLDGYAYTKDEVEKRLQPQTFGLWKGLGGQYAFTDSANVYVNCGQNFRKIIGPYHIPFIYDRMLIQALLYQASLRLYDKHISSVTRIMRENVNIEAIRDQLKEFISFTNRYWFHNLTEQMQGKEIFRLQQNALGLAEHYSIIKDELERTAEYIQTEQEVRMAAFSDRVSRWGLVLALLAIYYSTLPIIIEYFRDLSQSSLWSFAGGWIHLSKVCPEIVGVVTVFGGPIIFTLLIVTILALRKRFC